MRSRFPSTYLIYASLGHFIAGKLYWLNQAISSYGIIADVFLVVSASTNGQLYCTGDMNLINSIVDPTIFCTLSGMVVMQD